MRVVGLIANPGTERQGPSKDSDARMRQVPSQWKSRDVMHTNCSRQHMPGFGTESAYSPGKMGGAAGDGSSLIGGVAN